MGFVGVVDVWLRGLPGRRQRLEFLVEFVSVVGMVDGSAFVLLLFLHENKEMPPLPRGRRALVVEAKHPPVKIIIVRPMMRNR